MMILALKKTRFCVATIYVHLTAPSFTFTSTAVAFAHAHALAFTLVKEEKLNGEFVKNV